MSHLTRMFMALPDNNNLSCIFANKTLDEDNLTSILSYGLAGFFFLSAVISCVTMTKVLLFDRHHTLLSTFILRELALFFFFGCSCIMIGRFYLQIVDPTFPNPSIYFILTLSFAVMYDFAILGVHLYFILALNAQKQNSNLIQALKDAGLFLLVPLFNVSSLITLIVLVGFNTPIWILWLFTYWESILSGLVVAGLLICLMKRHYSKQRKNAQLMKVFAVCALSLVREVILKTLSQLPLTISSTIKLMNAEVKSTSFLLADSALAFLLFYLLWFFPLAFYTIALWTPLEDSHEDENQPLLLLHPEDNADVNQVMLGSILRAETRCCSWHQTVLFGFFLYPFAALLFLWGLHEACFSLAGNKYGILVMFARSGARVAAFLIPIAVVVVLQLSIKKVRKNAFGIFLPLKHAYLFHRHLAVLAVLFSTVHVVSWVVMFILEEDYFFELRYDNYLLAVITGVMMLLTLIGIVITGVHFSPKSKYSYNHFLFWHKVFCIIFLLNFCIHGWERKANPYPFGAILSTIVFIAYIIEWVLRYRASFNTRNWYIMEVSLPGNTNPENTKELYLLGVKVPPGYIIQHGMYTNVSLPDVAGLEDHPFSFFGYKNTLLFVISNDYADSRNHGKRRFIELLRDEFKKCEVNNKQLAVMSIGAPLATEVTDSLHYGMENVLFIGTGTGVVPVFSAFFGKMQQYATVPCQVRLLFKTRWNDQLQERLKKIVTKAKKAVNIPDGNFHMEKLQGKIKHASDWTQYLNAFCTGKNEVHIFACIGDDGLMTSLIHSVGDFNRDNICHITFHKEVFNK